MVVPKFDFLCRFCVVIIRYCGGVDPGSQILWPLTHLWYRATPTTPLLEQRGQCGQLPAHSHTHNPPEPKTWEIFLLLPHLLSFSSILLNAQHQKAVS